MFEAWGVVSAAVCGGVVRELYVADLDLGAARLIAVDGAVVHDVCVDWGGLSK